MDISGPCRLVRIIINEDSIYKGHNLYHALVLKLRELDIAGVTVSRGIEGYGKGKRLQTARILDLSSDLPVIVEAVDTPERIEAVLPVIGEMVKEGLVMVSDVRVVQYGKEY